MQQYTGCHPSRLQRPPGASSDHAPGRSLAAGSREGLALMARRQHPRLSRPGRTESIGSYIHHPLRGWHPGRPGRQLGESEPGLPGPRRAAAGRQLRSGLVQLAEDHVLRLEEEAAPLQATVEATWTTAPPSAAAYTGDQRGPAPEQMPPHIAVSHLDFRGDSFPMTPFLYYATPTGLRRKWSWDIVAITAAEFLNRFSDRSAIFRDTAVAPVPRAVRLRGS
jgi:hypothetical protein